MTEETLKKEIETLRTDIPKRDVFKEDKTIISSDYYNWKDVYEAINKAVDLGILSQKAKEKEFLRRLKKEGEEAEWDIMLEDKDGGDITISFNDWIDKLSKEIL